MKRSVFFGFLFVLCSVVGIGSVRSALAMPRGDNCTVQPNAYLIYAPNAVVHTSVAVQASAFCTGNGGTLTVTVMDNGHKLKQTASSCKTKGRACTATSRFIPNVKGHVYSASTDTIPNS